MARTQKSKHKMQKQENATKKQRGNGAPWLVNVKKSYEVTRDMTKLCRNPSMFRKPKKKIVAGYKREHKKY